MRRRPVPREWREYHHWLSVRATRNYGGQRGSGYYSRASGRCSCGVLFGTLAGNHTRNAADVRNDWLDHVENAYYEAKEKT